MSKQPNNIYSLISDMHNVITEGKKTVSSENVDKFVESLRSEALRFFDPEERKRASYLRMSNIGREDRKLWYEMKSEPIQHPPELLLKFFYGNLVEAFILFLVAVSLMLNLLLTMVLKSLNRVRFLKTMLLDTLVKSQDTWKQNSATKVVF